MLEFRLGVEHFPRWLSGKLRHKENRLQKASFITLTLARFGTQREAGQLTPHGDDPIFAGIGTDSRAAGTWVAPGTSVPSKTAYKFGAIALHRDKESADSYYDARDKIFTWLADAKEVWSAVLRPIRHVGEVDFLDPVNPGLIYDCPAEAVPPGPLVVITTAGFVREGDWKERALDFSNGVTAVRIAMTGMPGLHSQQSFSLEGRDGFTVTIWKDFASVRDFAYGPGVHKDYHLRQRAGGFADRTSFTRCVVERSEGIWHGSEPFENLI